jgi:anaerobic magnesium-protoporphyrin IX monomethyl ester cyclase
LRSYGYCVEVLDFNLAPEHILKVAKSLDPILIGFSLIFQFYIERFGEVIRYLRQHEVNCHFTMGGHFPSLSFEHTIELVPELDSVVRFEGETTLIELVDLLSEGKEWRAVEGIAYRKDGVTIATTLRPLVHDLDELPYPERRSTMRLLGRQVMPMLASRGCIRTCSFCSIHVFYRSAPGKVVRTRKPARVVEEMRWLNQEKGTTVFLFQDDDFPLYGTVWKRWASDFVDELHRNKLVGRIIWKINCRADAVDEAPELIARMRDAGLYLVYMGLESGSEEGLSTLHKQITVEQNLKAVEILKDLGVMFEYGFMLFDPSTTFDSVRDNLQFLRAIVGDGSSPASFCRMVPYDGTPIKDELARSGRLKGDIIAPDYDFLDPRIDDFFHALNRIVHVSGWIHGIEALTPQLQFAKAEVAAIEVLFPPIPGFDEYKEMLREITRDANELLFRVVEDTSYVFTDGAPSVWTPEAVRAECEVFRRRFLTERNSFIGSNQHILMEALKEEIEREAAYA